MFSPYLLKNARAMAVGSLAAVALWVSPASAQSPATDKASIVARGEYLAQAGDCVACHTAPGGKLFAGGRAMPTPFGTLYTSNVTPTATPASASGPRTRFTQ
jgi:mono/diheme cytochrome c family protein